MQLQSFRSTCAFAACFFAARVLKRGWALQQRHSFGDRSVSLLKTHRMKSTNLD